MSVSAATSDLMPPTAEKRLYKSTSKFCNVVTTKGHVLHFKAGHFATNNPAYIEFLDKEISEGGFAGTIFIDPNARTLTAEQENPMLALEKQFYAKFLAEQAAHLNPGNNMGTSEQGKLNAASTTSIAPVAANGAPVNSAQLVALAAGSTPKN